MNRNNQFIQEAVRESVKSVQSGGGPFGAVIVKEGKIIARAGNTVTLEPDPTAHAEVNAIRMAAHDLDSFDLSGCEIYCSCEPCPMCLGAIYWARLDKIYFASKSQKAQEFGFDDSFIYKECEKPFHLRSISMVELKIENADAGFKEWKIKEDKTKY